MHLSINRKIDNTRFLAGILPSGSERSATRFADNTWDELIETCDELIAASARNPKPQSCVLGIEHHQLKPALTSFDTL